MQQAAPGTQQAAPGAQQSFALGSVFSSQQAAPGLQQSACGWQQSGALTFTAGGVLGLGRLAVAGSAKAKPVSASTEISMVFMKKVLLKMIDRVLLVN
ncbi:MAG: hypothetical protein KF760_05805 [Candidatus Eremiobacteraeota bacterium]|nr:hypothetical protein [Candidatus Eremiobacteraeota bacterium]MCW5867090.1 hypothetical protein [Candidatus Eremiobacteraeota bacterium]